MENQDDNEKKLDKVDSYLTKFGVIMKKHWGKLLFLLFCYCVWWAFNQPPLPKEDPKPEQSTERKDAIIIEDTLPGTDSVN